MPFLKNPVDFKDRRTGARLAIRDTRDSPISDDSCAQLPFAARKAPARGDTGAWVINPGTGNPSPYGVRTRVRGRGSEENPSQRGVRTRFRGRGSKENLNQRGVRARVRGRGSEENLSQWQHRNNGFSAVTRETSASGSAETRVLSRGTKKPQPTEVPNIRATVRPSTSTFSNPTTHRRFA